MRGDRSAPPTVKPQQTRPRRAEPADTSNPRTNGTHPLQARSLAWAYAAGCPSTLVSTVHPPVTSQSLSRYGKDPWAPKYQRSHLLGARLAQRPPASHLAWTPQGGGNQGMRVHAHCSRLSTAKVPCWGAHLRGAEGRSCLVGRRPLWAEPRPSDGVQGPHHRLRGALLWLRALLTGGEMTHSDFILFDAEKDRKPRSLSAQLGAGLTYLPGHSPLLGHSESLHPA